MAAEPVLEPPAWSRRCPGLSGPAAATVHHRTTHCGADAMTELLGPRLCSAQGAGQQTGAAQHLQVMRDRRLGQIDALGQVASTCFLPGPRRDRAQQPQPYRIRQRLEHHRQLRRGSRRQRLGARGDGLYGSTVATGNCDFDMHRYRQLIIREANKRPVNNLRSGPGGSSGVHKSRHEHLRTSKCPGSRAVCRNDRYEPHRRSGVADAGGDPPPADRTWRRPLRQRSQANLGHLAVSTEI